jgi:hypothetical protein
MRQFVATDTLICGTTGVAVKRGVGDKVAVGLSVGRGDKVDVGESTIGTTP